MSDSKGAPSSQSMAGKSRSALEGQPGAAATGGRPPEGCTTTTVLSGGRTHHGKRVEEHLPAGTRGHCSQLPKEGDSLGRMLEMFQIKGTLGWQLATHEDRGSGRSLQSPIPPQAWLS